MNSLLENNEFLKLEKEYKFLSRFRENKKLDNLNYVIVDIETTGLDPNNDEIIEIGAIQGQVQNPNGLSPFPSPKGEGNGERPIFSQLIKPSLPIPNHIERLTGISQEMVADKPQIKEVIAEFDEFIKDAILIAHNTDFDISFIKTNYKKSLNKEFKNNTLCTVKLSRVLTPGLFNYKLHTVAKHFNIPIPNRHRAIGDCEITHGIWKEILKLLGAKQVTTLKEIIEIEKMGSYRP